MMKPWNQTEPFVHLTDSQLKELNQSAELCRYPKGAVLFREGEPADSLWVLQQGWVRLVKRTADGKFLTLDLVTPKDGVCGLSAFSDHNRYVATAVAAPPVEAVRLPALALRELLKSHPQFAACVTGILNQRFRHIAAAYADAYAPVEQRIASVLLRLTDDFGAHLPITRRELAELTGTTVETAIRITRRMQEEGTLRISRGRVTVLHPRSLSGKINRIIASEKGGNSQ